MDGEYTFKRVSVEDAERLLSFLCKLDGTARWMYYAPGERIKSVHDLRGHIRGLKSNSKIFVCYDVEQIVGYLGLYGGRQQRVAHVASLTVGVLPAYRSHGIAGKLWLEAQVFCKEIGIKRVELSVVCENIEAIAVYKSWGFEYYGLRIGSFMDGFPGFCKIKYRDELLMFKGVA